MVEGCEETGRLETNKNLFESSNYAVQTVP